MAASSSAGLASTEANENIGVLLLAPWSKRFEHEVSEKRDLEQLFEAAYREGALHIHEVSNARDPFIVKAFFYTTPYIHNSENLRNIRKPVKIAASAGIYAMSFTADRTSDFLDMHEKEMVALTDLGPARYPDLRCVVELLEHLKWQAGNASNAIKRKIRAAAERVRVFISGTPTGLAASS